MKFHGHEPLYGAAVTQMRAAAGVARAPVRTGERSQLRVGEHCLDQSGPQLVERAADPLRQGAEQDHDFRRHIDNVRRSPRVAMLCCALVGGLVGIEYGDHRTCMFGDFVLVAHRRNDAGKTGGDLGEPLQDRFALIHHASCIRIRRSSRPFSITRLDAPSR